MGYIVLGLILVYLVVLVVYWLVQAIGTVALPVLILSFFCITAYFAIRFIHRQLQLGFCLKWSSLKSLGLLALLCLGLTAIWANSWPEIVIPFMLLLQPIVIRSESLFIPMWIWLFVNACALRIAIVWIASRHAEIASLILGRIEILKCALAHFRLTYHQWLSKRHESAVRAAYGQTFAHVNKLQTLTTQLVGTNARPLGIQKTRLKNVYRQKTSAELYAIVQCGSQQTAPSNGDVLAMALARQELIFRSHKRAFLASQAVASRRADLDQKRATLRGKQEAILTHRRQAQAIMTRRNQEKIVL